MMSLRTASLLATLAICGRAQDGENAFYKAFYLETGERKYEEATELYKKFLAASADSKLAPVAARHLIQVLHRVGKSDEANVASDKYAAILKNAPPAEDTSNPPERGARRVPGGAGPDAAGGIAGPGGGRRGGMDPAAREALTSEVEKLKKDLAAAEKDGNADKIAALKTQVADAERRLEGMRNGGGRMGGGPGAAGPGGARRGGGLTPPKPLAEMTEAERTEWVTTTKATLSTNLERMRENGMEEQAKTLEDGIKKVEELIKAGKFAEADEALRNARPFGRRGGQGGNQGNGGQGNGGNGGGQRPPAGGTETRPIR